MVKATGVTCVVLAGGLATRMRPITETIPKSLIPINGRPFVKIQLEWLSKQLVTDVIFSIGYKGTMIQDVVGDGTEFGLRVVYVDEGELLRGTGGALKFCFKQGVLPEKFFVLYGDSFLPISFPEVWTSFDRQEKPALMTVFENSGKWDKSNVCFEDEKIVLYDKHQKVKTHLRMNHIDYGLSILSRPIVEDWLPEPVLGEKTDLAEVFHTLSQRGLLAGYEVKERFYEIGSLKGLSDFEKWDRENR